MVIKFANAIEEFRNVQQTGLQTMKKHRWLEGAQTILVAVSGGPDSIALLHWLNTALMEYGIRIACAHYNHGFRGAESDADETFVARVCAQWHIPFYSEKGHLQNIVAAGGVNAQALAREYRYRFLQQIAIHIGANRIAVAHHRDDQIETILMRLIRGTGTTGLIGMPYARELAAGITVIRPLLDCTKEQITEYLSAHQLDSRSDSSNWSMDYRRNRVRMELLPLLAQYNTHVGTAVVELSRMLAEDEAELAQMAAAQFADLLRMQRVKKGEFHVSVTTLHALSHSLQRRIIKLICNYLSDTEEEVPYAHIEALRSLWSQPEPRQWDLPWSIRVYVRYGEVYFRRTDVLVGVEPFHFTFSAPATLTLPNGTFTCSLVNTMDTSEDAYTVYYDYDRIAHAFTLRTRRRGDRIGSMRVGGYKKVKDILIDTKIPRENREGIPLLFAGDELIWIVGVRKSTHGTYDSTTKRYLCCRYVPNEE